MAQKVPFGIRYSQGLNRIIMFLMLVMGCIGAAVVIGNFMKGVEEAGGSVNPLIGLLTGLVPIGLFLIPVFLLRKQNALLQRLDESARVYQIIVAVLFVFGFPVGTILFGLNRYYMLFDRETLDACKGQSAQPATPTADH